MRRGLLIASLTIACATALLVAQTPPNRPMSPNGSAVAQVLGKWTEGARPSFTLGRGTYSGGKWIEITYGRPLQRGRDLFGRGANYGKAALVDTEIWRAGANVSTRLKTEVPLVIGGKTVAIGEYSLFIDLKENNWTLVVSSWPAQPRYDANDKTALWGSYNYTPDKDVVRVKMTLETAPHAHEQLTWEFLDMTDTGGAMAIVWGKQMAWVPFTVGM
jgi:hypothetical protein